MHKYTLFGADSFWGRSFVVYGSTP